MKSSAPSDSPRPAASTTRRRRENLALRYFLRGLVVLVPVTLTTSIIYWLFRKVDGLFNPYIESTGLGALLVFSLIFGVGWISFSPLRNGYLGG